MLPAIGANLLVGVGTALLLPCCIVPGLIFGFLTMQTPYLVVTRDIGIFDAFFLSIDRAKRHWGLLLSVVGAMILGMFCVGAITGVAGAIVGMLSGVLGVFALYGTAIFSWLATTAAGFFVWLAWAAAFSQIDEAEGDVPPATAPGGSVW